MKAYLSTFAMRWKMELQYRGAVIGGVICQIFFGLILVSLYGALYRSKPQNLPLEAVASYVWLQQAFFRMLLSTDTDLLDKIRTGGIAYELCRPIHLYGFYYARMLAQKLLGSLLRGGGFRLIQLVLVQRLDLLHAEVAAAVVAPEPAGASFIMQRTRAGRALKIGDLRGHGCPPLV